VILKDRHESGNNTTLAKMAKTGRKRGGSIISPKKSKGTIDKP
jgi:hypothetical protein